MSEIAALVGLGSSKSGVTILAECLMTEGVLLTIFPTVLGL